MGFELTTTEMRSDDLIDRAIRPWVQLTLRANFVQLLQFHLFVQCSRLTYVFLFVSRHIYFKRSVAQIITLVAEWSDTYGIHHRKIIRSSYRRLAWVGFEPTVTEFRSDALTDWAIRLYIYVYIYIYMYKLYFSTKEGKPNSVAIAKTFFKKTAPQIL